MFGRLENPANEALRDLSGREMATFIPLIILAFWIGVFPKPFLEIIDKPVEKIIRIVNPASAREQPAVAARPAPGTLKPGTAIEAP
jgi:NADH-quinone oxidoreductase subunit M